MIPLHFVDDPGTVWCDCAIVEWELRCVNESGKAAFAGASRIDPGWIVK